MPASTSTNTTQLTFGVFYTGGPTLPATYGKFVKS